MADVGVLNLQIHDNSEQAVQGLDKLTDALGRVKTAVSGGLKLGKIATDLERIGKVVDDSIHGSTIAKISQLGEALSQLKGLDNVRITIKDGGNSVQIRDALGNSAQLIDTISQTSQTMASEMTEGFGQAAAGVRQATEAYEDMKDRMAEAKGTGNGLDFSVFDPSKLPLDALGMKIDESGQQWRQYGEMIKDSFDTIKNAGALDTVTSSVEEVGRSTMAIIPYNENLENSWERISARMDEAKQKAAEYEAIRKEREANFYAEPEKKEYTMVQTNAMADNLTQLDLLKAKLREAEEQYNKFANTLGTDSAKTVAAGLKVSDLRDKICEYTDALKQANSEAATNGMDKVTEYMDSSKIDLLTEKYNALQTSLAQDIQNGKVDAQTAIDRAIQIRNLGNQIEELKQKEEDASESTHRLRNAFESFRSGIKNLGITKLLGQFARIAKYRFLRAVIRQITSAFSEGVQNVYNYSKAIGSSFAPSMDAAATSLQQMKNSIGAAIAPVIQALVPVLQTVVNWFITAINYVNQFLSLLRGQATWTRALPATTTAFGEQEKAAKKAGAAIKDLLADWDELNIIQGQTGGGGGLGGASTAEDYLNMFEEVGVFDSKIKKIVEFIKDNMDRIKDIAVGIGAAILGWKVSTLFSGFIGTLGALVDTAATIDFTLRLTDAFGQQFVSSGKPGWFIADALTGAVGATLAGQLAAKIAGGAWGSITSGFTLMLAGEVNLKNGRSAYAQSKIAEGQMLSILGSVEEGIGAALIAAGFTASTPVAVGIGAAVALYSYVVNALAAVNITGVKWGENTMTPEEIKTYVTTNMLSVDIDSQVKITHAAIDLAEGEQQKLAEQATALLQPVNALKLGVNIEDSLTQIKNDVFGDGGLLAQFKSFTSAQKELVNTAETYVPTIDASGNNISGEIMKESNSAWAELNGLMDDLGTDLSKHLTRAMDKTLSEELRQFEMNAVTEITDTMIRVSLAGKKATISSDALTDLAFDLSTASKGTFSDVINVYKQYVDSLTAENMELKKAEASTFASSAAMYEEFAQDALRKAGGNETDEMYLYYKGKAEHFADEYGKIMSNLAGSVEASVNEAVAPGKELVKQSIATMLAGAKEIKDGRLELFTGGKIKGLPTGLAGGLKENTSLAIQNLMFGGMNEGITEANADSLEKLYKDWLDAIIKDFMPEDFNLIKEMIDLGLIDYSDIFDADTLFQTMELQGFGNNPFYKEMWERLFGTDKPETPKLDNTALNQSVTDAKASVDDMCSSIRASIASLEGLGFSFDTSADGGNVTGRMRVTVPKIAKAATGGFIKSGDLVMANENGQFEMMGRMGNQPVIANNDQIISGISQGVSAGNDRVADKLDILIAETRKQKTAEVRISPSSGWGNHNARSQEAWERVNG